MEDCALWRLHSHPTHCVCVCLCMCAYVCACMHMCVPVRAYARVCTCAHMHAGVRTGLGYRRCLGYPPVTLRWDRFGSFTKCRNLPTSGRASLLPGLWLPGFLLIFPSLCPFPTRSPPHQGSLYLQPVSKHVSPSPNGHIHGPHFLQSQMDTRLLLTRPSLDKISPAMEPALTGRTDERRLQGDGIV